jgi:acetyltransferase-like isoleucine patch superfamily enzyme
VTVGKYAILECTGVLSHVGKGVVIGDGSSVGDYSFIGAAGGVAIGKRVLMGQRVSIHAQNHAFMDAAISIADQGTTQQGVSIGDDCWLGSGSIILDGVELGAGTVVAAGSVVTKSFPPRSVVAGVPARLVSARQAGDAGPPASA